MSESPSDWKIFVSRTTRPQALAWLSALLLSVLSALGLLFPRLVYPNAELAQEFLANDLVNLLIGLPFIVGSLWLLRRRSVTGVLLLPGALVYVIYNYLAYALGRPWDWFAPLCLALVLLCAYVLIDYLRLVDHEAVKARLDGLVPRKLSGWVLVIFGAAFLLLAASQIISGIQAGTIPPLADQAVSIADLLVSALWLAGGVVLLLKKPFGYSAGLGLLSAASSLFIGLILFMLISPPLTGRPFDLAGVLTLLPMSLISFVPTFLFWKGVARGGNRYESRR